jgi:peptide/nickel transport system substrate-binding protein
MENGTLDTGEVAFQSLDRLRQVDGFKFNSSEDTGQQQWHLHGQFYGADRPGYAPEKPWVSSNADINSPEWDTARKVRLALAIAIDRDLIVDSLLGGEGRAQHYWGDSGNTVLNPLKEANPEPFAYDPDRAMVLLEEAGYPDGFDLDTACYSRGLPSDIQVCEAVTSMWEAIGINTTVQKLPYATLRPMMFDRDMEVIHPHGLGTYPEPMALWPNAAWSEGGWNAGFEHPILDEMIAAALVQADPVKRFELTREISQWMVDNVTHIPVYSPNIIYPVGPKIDSWPLQGGDKKLIHNLELIPPRQ